MGGLSYDQVEFPQNHRFAPLSSETQRDDQLSPKAGFILTPATNTTFRGAYSRSLSGASLDQSYRLEPTQVAGFNQAYRSLIPETIDAANAGARFETWGLSLEQKFGPATHVALAGEWLESDADRWLGLVERPAAGPLFPRLTRQTLHYREQTAALTVNQLLGDYWSVGARYRVSNAEFDTRMVEFLSSLALDGVRPRQDLEATLHQVNLFALLNLPSGLFAQADALWYGQSNHGYSGGLPGDDFWQFNVSAGYRFARRRAEVRVGLLNLTDQDYHLNPLNVTAELPRERTVALSFRFSL